MDTYQVFFVIFHSCSVKHSRSCDSVYSAVRWLDTIASPVSNMFPWFPSKVCMCVSGHESYLGISLGKPANGNRQMEIKFM